MTSKHLQMFAAALLLLAAILGAVAWRSAHKPPAPVAVHENGKTLYPVVVTTKPVEAGKPIGADAVAVEMLPVNPDDGFSEVSKVVGREPIVTLGIGVPLIGSQLSSGLALQVIPGQRAVAVMVDEVIGVGNRVQPGDYVDVFLIMRKDGQEVDGSRANLLLPHLRVLAFGAVAVNEGPQKAQDGAAAARKTEPARTAVLSVPVEAVSRLAMAHQSGRLLLALRNPSDDAEPTVKPQDAALLAAANRNPMDVAQVGVSLNSLTSSAHERGPAVLQTQPLPPAIVARSTVRSSNAGSGVEIIRAGKREEQHD
ncbi:Flp pilus assembly protein CpaB [Ralstonia insidiosa]|uniref:Flp pilus assembly protein CpaB n=1 Tax=Ralstonia insidiosa TaxID=190721 RepID=A0A192A3D4_9RALS|nr:Flp pilus assembly protein CpaB [Ralstonia insidiosa]ANJ74802.1 Flp pilus assembly protein CpaB [Ralstonia insidiosa]KAB0467299.1 Flp pilus assembly protein CpaB [Ralstonia insidiosa]MBY4909527.1 Flp pilus assembly protein CpaB [Ralstonia insidiosa]